MTWDKTDQMDQIQVNRTKGSDFLTAFVQFGFHCSCIVHTPATDNGQKRFVSLPVPDWISSCWRSKSIGTKTVYGNKERSDFLIVKLSFILYLTTQESTSEVGLLPVINPDISEGTLNTNLQRGINHCPTIIDLFALTNCVWKPIQSRNMLNLVDMII